VKVITELDATAEYRLWFDTATARWFIADADDKYDTGRPVLLEGLGDFAPKDRSLVPPDEVTLLDKLEGDPAVKAAAASLAETVGLGYANQPHQWLTHVNLAIFEYDKARRAAA
jgi:hypothetical protein